MTDKQDKQAYTPLGKTPAKEKYTSEECSIFSTWVMKFLMWQHSKANSLGLCFGGGLFPLIWFAATIAP